MRTSRDGRPWMSSDVRAGLSAIHWNARAVDEAGLLGANERHQGRHLLDGAEAAERHLAQDELSDRIRVGLLAAVPSATFPEDGTRRDAVDGHSFRGDFPRHRSDKADLSRLGGVVGGSAARLAAPDG